MELEFHDSFGKDIDKVRNTTAKTMCLGLIEKMKVAGSLREVPHVKKLEGFKNYYRIKIGDYRIGIEYKNSKIIFKRFLSRKDIYKYFP